MSATTSSGASSASDNLVTETVTDADTSLKFANKTLKDYEVISVIGNGTFGTCFKVRDKNTGEMYAWKGIDYDELSESKKASLVSEIRVLRQLQHPNIVQYYHHLVNHEAKSIFIVMECCEGGDLAQLIKRARTERKRFEERYIWRVLFQVCKALQVCHNKIRKGTILHRDIKPANIFLDEHGNAKLGDFGLARMLRKNQNFAATFVGTPYYMSPELVKGSRYDRKSDVWAMGCLAYEMCALRTPFQANKFDELTENIANGKFNHIPCVYTSDLQEIIAYMLSVDSEQRPSIEVITRHPTLVRNINELGNEFPTLIKAELDFFILDENIDMSHCKLQYNSPEIEFSSTTYTEKNSFSAEYGHRRLSLAFTPDLRTELFSSVKRRLYAKTNKLQRSDPELYESIKHAHYTSINDITPLRPPIPPPKPPYVLFPSNSPPPAPAIVKAQLISPAQITENVFNEALQDRLRAIRAQESLMQLRKLNLDEREQQLIQREKRLQQLESSLCKRELDILAKERKSSNVECSRTVNHQTVQLTEEPIQALSAPPVPPRKSSQSKHDETYCSIEDTQLESPTIAKLSLPLAKTLPALRRVTFQSPQTFFNYNIDNHAVNAVQTKNQAFVIGSSKRQSEQLQGSVSSKDSRDSVDSGIITNSDAAFHTTTITQTRRRSILTSLFGLHRSSKVASKSDCSNNKCKSLNGAIVDIKINQKQHQKPSSATTIIHTNDRFSLGSCADQVLAKCETSELNNIWTKEHKRAAFDLLAAMNAGQNVVLKGPTNAVQYSGSSLEPTTTTNILHGRQKLRQSTRERHNTTLRRHHHMRRSLMVPSFSVPPVATASGGAVCSIPQNSSRDKMLV